MCILNIKPHIRCVGSYQDLLNRKGKFAQVIRAFNEEDDHEDDDVPVEEPAAPLPVGAVIVPGPDGAVIGSRVPAEVTLAPRVERALSRPRGYSRLESVVDGGARPRGYSRLESLVTDGGAGGARGRTESTMSQARRRSAELRAKVLGAVAPPADPEKKPEEKKDGTKLIEDEGMGTGTRPLPEFSCLLFVYGIIFCSYVRNLYFY